MFNKFKKMLSQRRHRKEIYSKADFWNSKVTEHEHSAISMWSNQTLNTLYEREQITFLLKHLNFTPGIKVLDLGCGTGRLSRWLAAQGAQVVGIDFAEKVLEQARAFSVDVSNPMYRHGSVFNLEDVDEYDYVVSWGVLTFAATNIKELTEVLVRIKKAMKKDARLLLMEPIHKGFLHRVLELDVVSFLNTMESVGFEIEVLEPLHFWPVRLLLSYISCYPAWVTKSLYCWGQGMMKLPGLKRCGDYWAIKAKNL
jgi:2-polyprenyl-3-methyl-5-hydroxy-6-metoxy-1,4-benzoquinol methylase